MTSADSFTLIPSPGAGVPPILVRGDLLDWLARGKGTRRTYLVDVVVSAIASGDIDTDFRGLHTFTEPGGHLLMFLEARLLVRWHNVFARPIFDGIGVLAIPSMDGSSGPQSIVLVPTLSGTVEIVADLDVGLDLDAVKGVTCDYSYPWEPRESLGPLRRSDSPEGGGPDWDEMMTLTELRNERGWTDTLIRDFLGEADESRPNPYGSNAPMRLYDRARVARVEATTEFQDAMSESQERRRIAQQRDTRRAQKTREELKPRLEALTADRLPPFANEDELLTEAIPEYNLWAMQNYADPFDRTTASPEQSLYVQIRYLAFNAPAVVDVMEWTKGKKGAAQLRAIVEDHLVEIAPEAYPWFR
ncbi:MAG: hypothetical protein GY926_07395 [bacterium]|nr:hypothetical protein [bacterium]